MKTTLAARAIAASVISLVNNDDRPSGKNGPA
jgi:hypothetical protein